MNIESGAINKIGGGSQAWRAVSLLQTDGCLIWGSDSEDEQNYIYRYDLSKKKLTKLFLIPGPAYYSTIDKKSIFYIGTTVEDRGRHKACIYRSVDGTQWEQLRYFRKDIWHSKYFGYGTVEFITGQNNLEKLFINKKGLI